MRDDYWCNTCARKKPCLSCNAGTGILVGAPDNWTAKQTEAGDGASGTPPPTDAGGAILDSGERTEFPTGAVRDMHGGKGRMDLLPWLGIIEVSRHCEEGALKYGEHNVDKGIPIHSLCDSAARHLAKYLIGMTDEPHLRAAAWNLLWALEMEIAHPELQDIPSRMEVSDGH